MDKFVLPKKTPNTSFGGLGVNAGSDSKLTHADRCKVKSQRFLDIVVKKSAK